MKQTIKILQLYPRDMNIYGDWGNALVLQRRAQWHGYNVELLEYNPGDTFPADIDIVVGGGGQDSGQQIIKDDLQKLKPQLQKLADDNVPMLVVCGLYQLFGHKFTLHSGDIIKGIGVLDIETIGGSERMIGNIHTYSEEFGDIVGYENHSGATIIGESTDALAKVIIGAGNNLSEGHEGAQYKNVIGTYLHGSLLPKNPNIADWLIEKACVRTFGEFNGNVIDDSFADQARATTLQRPR